MVLAWAVETDSAVIDVKRCEDVTSLSRVPDVEEISRANTAGEDSDLVLEVVQLESTPVPEMAGAGARVKAGV